MTGISRTAVLTLAALVAFAGATAADVPSWPCYQGPNGNFSAGDEVGMADRKHGLHGPHEALAFVLIACELGQQHLQGDDLPGAAVAGPDYDATGYEMPISHPVVAGRLYLRGADGIYCWDLRKPAR